MHYHHLSDFIFRINFVEWGMGADAWGMAGWPGGFMGMPGMRAPGRCKASGLEKSCQVGHARSRYGSRFLEIDKRVGEWMKQRPKSVTKRGGERDGSLAS